GVDAWCLHGGDGAPRCSQGTAGRGTEREPVRARDRGDGAGGGGDAERADRFSRGRAGDEGDGGSGPAGEGGRPFVRAGFAAPAIGPAEGPRSKGIGGGGAKADPGSAAGRGLATTRGNGPRRGGGGRGLDRSVQPLRRGSGSGGQRGL